jgi:hypothetical protein
LCFPPRVQTESTQIRLALDQSDRYRAIFRPTFPGEGENFKLIHFLSLVIVPVCYHAALVRWDGIILRMAGLENRAVRERLVAKYGMSRKCLFCGFESKNPAGWMNHLMREHECVKPLDDSAF